MDSLDNPSKPPITIYKRDRWDDFKNDLDPKDQVIVERLQKLLEDDNKRPAPPSTTEDIRRRLALLKDQDPDYIPPKNVKYLQCFSSTTLDK